MGDAPVHEVRPDPSEMVAAGVVEALVARTESEIRAMRLELEAVSEMADASERRLSATLATMVADGALEAAVLRQVGEWLSGTRPADGNGIDRHSPPGTVRTCGTNGQVVATAARPPAPPGASAPVRAWSGRPAVSAAPTGRVPATPAQGAASLPPPPRPAAASDRKQPVATSPPRSQVSPPPLPPPPRVHVSPPPPPTTAVSDAPRVIDPATPPAPATASHLPPPPPPPLPPAPQAPPRRPRTVVVDRSGPGFHPGPAGPAPEPDHARPPAGVQAAGEGAHPVRRAATAPPRGWTSRVPSRLLIQVGIVIVVAALLLLKLG
jgi:hypothetical protein